MAQKTRKSRAGTTRKRDSIGQGVLGVPYYEVKVKGRWCNRWRVDKRHSDIPKHMQRRYFNSREDARAFARELHDRLVAVHMGDLMPESALKGDLTEHLIASKNIIKFNNRVSNEFLPDDCVDMTISKSVNVATQFLDGVVAVNRFRQNNGKDSWSIIEAIEYMQSNAIREARRVNVPYSKHIETFLKWKLGATGSKRGGDELELDSKHEWKRYIGLLKKWAGKDIVRSGTEGKETLKKVDKKIANMVSPNGKRWAALTRKKCAEKTKQFGMWMVREDIVKKNPFERLTDGYSNISKEEKKAYTVEQVEEYFVKAMQSNDGKEVLKYVIMTFFSTLRPSEVAYQDNKRRLEWGQIKFDEEKDTSVKGAVLIWCPQWKDTEDGEKMRGSKTSSRWAMLYPNGVKWLKWYCDTYNDGEPLKEFYFHRKAIDRHRDSLSFDIIKDGPRHTSISMALKHFVFEGLRDRLSNRYGHEIDVQKTVYEAPLTTGKAAKFFEITPAKLIKKYKINLKEWIKD